MLYGFISQDPGMAALLLHNLVKKKQHTLGDVCCSIDTLRVLDVVLLGLLHGKIYGSGGKGLQVIARYYFGGKY